MPREPLSFDVDCLPSQKRMSDERDVRYEHLVERFGPNGKFLPKLPMAMNCIGRIGSGKTSFVWTLLNNWYAQYWDVVVIYTGTKDSNEDWRKLDQRTVEVRNHWDVGEFAAWIKEIEEENLERVHDGKVRRRYCVLFDDMIAKNILKPHTATLLEDVLLNLRHYNLSVILCSQGYKKLSKTARINALFFAVFRVHKVEIEGFAKEASMHLTEEQVLAMYDWVMKNPPPGVKRPYLFVDVCADPPENAFRQGMTNVLHVVPAAVEGETPADAPVLDARAPKRRRQGAAK